MPNLLIQAVNKYRAEWQREPDGGGWRLETKKDKQGCWIQHMNVRRNSHSLSATPMQTYTSNPPVDLGGVLTLGVGVLRGSHLQHAHPEGVDVHRFIVLLLIHLWSHKLRGSWWKGEEEQWIITFCFDLSAIILDSTVLKCYLMEKSFQISLRILPLLQKYWLFWVFLNSVNNICILCAVYFTTTRFK